MATRPPEDTTHWARSPRALGALLAAGDTLAFEAVRGALERHRGAVGRAARELGVSRATLHRWMARAGIRGRGTPGPTKRLAPPGTGED